MSIGKTACGLHKCTEHGHLDCYCQSQKCGSEGFCGWAVLLPVINDLQRSYISTMSILHSNRKYVV